MKISNIKENGSQQPQRSMRKKANYRILMIQQCEIMDLEP